MDISAEDFYFLNINKPKGITSFDVIRKLRKVLHTKQIGHSGTLDPLASGVMQIGVGNCAKLLDYLKSDKTYIADIVFGYVTDTFDDEGEKIFVKKPDFSEQMLLDCLNTFAGKTLQIPPKYSAIKQNGQKLCDIMRNNPDMDIEIKPREIEIYSIELLEFSPLSPFCAKIKVHSKKGTYIRSLIYDLGQKLGCGAYMKELVRVQAGDFKIENSNNLDDIEHFIKINPIDVLDYLKYELDDFEFDKISHGNFIKPKNELKETLKEGTIILTKHNKLVSISILSDNLIKPKKNFMRN